MKNSAVPSSIKFLYWLSSISIWLLTLITVLIIGLATFKTLLPESNRSFISFELPVEVGGDLGTFSWNEREYEVLFASAVGKVVFQVNEMPDFLINVNLWLLVLFLMMTNFLFWTFRKFIRNVRNDQIFELSNIRYLKHISYSFIGLWIVQTLYKWILFKLVVNGLQFEHLKIGKNFDFDVTLILIALIIWVISHVFITGIKMKEELELTI